MEEDARGGEDNVKVARDEKEDQALSSEPKRQMKAGQFKRVTARWKVFGG